MRIAAYDMLRVTRRHTGKNGYQEIYDALFRLRSTTITTDIQSGGERETRGFGWIDSFRILTKENKAGNRVMQGLEITLNDWTFRALVKDRRVLAINPAYFDLTGGLERRLYEIARKHVGRQAEWKVSLLLLAKKCGTMQRNLRRFKFDLKELAELDRLPDYQMFLVNDHASPTAKAMEAGGMKGVQGRQAHAERGGDRRVQAARCAPRCVEAAAASECLITSIVPVARTIRRAPR